MPKARILRVRSFNIRLILLEEASIQNAKLDIKVGFAMSATNMHLMAIYTAKLEL